WDANNDFNQYLGKSKDGWDIWALVDGPGVVTRIWCNKLAGEIQIVVDGKVALSGAVGDFFKGGVAPLGEPLTYVISADGKDAGVNYFPIGFSRSIAIQTRGFDGAYQVDAISLSPGTRVTPFDSELDSDASKGVEAVSKAFKSGLKERQLFPKRVPEPVGTSE